MGGSPVTPQPIDYNALAAQAGAVDSTPPTQTTASTPSQQPGAVDYNALAAQNGAISSGPAPAAPPTPTLWDKVSTIAHSIWAGDGGNASGNSGGTGVMPANMPKEMPAGTTFGYEAKNVAVGAAKSAGQTLSTVGDIATLGATHLIPRTQAAADASDATLTASNDDQKLGANVETVMEFMAGDEALKSLSLADRFSQVGKIGKFVSQNPRLAEVLGDAIRTGSVGAVSGGAHGGSEGAVAGAIGGAALGAVGGAIADVPEATESTTSAPALSNNPVEAEVAKGVVKSGLPEGEDLASGAQQNLQDSFKAEIHSIADDANVPRPSEGTAPDMIREVADAQYNRAKASYAALDDATDGKFQPNADAIANINDELRDSFGIDPAQDTKLQAQKVALLKTQDALFDEAAEAGVPRETVDAARSDFKSSQAKNDMANQLQMSAQSDNPDLLNAKTLTNRLTKFNVSGEGGSASRLEQAVGEDHAANLLSHAKTAQALSKLSPTEGRALAKLIEPNTKTSLVSGGKTDWAATLRDFDSLSPKTQKAQFSNPEAVRDFLRGKARGQLVNGAFTRKAEKQPGALWGGALGALLLGK